MTFIFADCEVHCDRRELRRKGTATHVEPQVFDVLVHLVQHRDRVVSKDELIREVWAGRFVSDDTLTSRVGAARRAIGDTGVEQRLIRTVTRRGFRFVADVQEVSSQCRATKRYVPPSNAMPRAFHIAFDTARLQTACISPSPQPVAARRSSRPPTG